MRVVVAKHAGVCYGVERALKLAGQAAEGGGTVRTLGPLIHNPQAVAALEDAGVRVASSLDDVAEGTLVIRSHGVDPAVITAAEERGLDVVDATCPFVRAAHRCAGELRDAGYAVVIVGEADHPEVEGILAHAGGEAHIVQRAADLPARIKRRVGVVVQTTQPPAVLAEVVAALLPRVNELRVCNTICSATEQRQASAAELADEVDVIIVVGGHNSGNTTRLAEICAARNPRTHHVETAEELDERWFDGASVVGVTAGASTPDEQIRGVIETVESLTGDE
ncbi:MAG: 4-hydroxy-3-methylbut-2-enyl diphosphate reductase [Aeromicrobium sp.]|jgi:4-hydroxy-3-methylbut-2-enyl diphosphate reductase|nr:4-hydroxy-3-methylbut-2-enyl diphosphate reductase [Aeromicrobium sp.]